MESNKQNIWASVEELNQDPSFLAAQEEEFQHDSEVPTALAENNGSRRDFLKFLGFSVGAATIAACEQPVRKAIPYVVKPDTIVPGVANYYATALVDKGDYVAALVKTRENRPIKIEGNVLSTVTKGGTSARAQAVVLSLYDTNRLKGANKIVGGAVDAISTMAWEKLDAEVKSKLAACSKIAIVANTIISPSAKAVIERFVAKYPTAKLSMYDAISCAALLKAHETAFGIRAIPGYAFNKADVVISFDADFLGSWVSPVEFAHDYSKRRKVKEAKSATKDMNWHVHFESGLSMTGSNADNRILTKPSEQATAVALLYNKVAAALGEPTITAPANALSNEKSNKALDKIAARLVEAKGKSIIVAGVNDEAVQTLVLKLNAILGNYGSTLDINRYSNQRQGNDNLLEELNGADGIIFWDANPVYDHVEGAKIAELIKKTKVAVSFSTSLDETAALCGYAAPDHHILEAWGDAEPKAGVYALMQPTIQPLFDTRAAQISLLTWAEDTAATETDQPYHEFVRKYWEENIFTKQDKYVTFKSLWENVLHDGELITTVSDAPAQAIDLDMGAIAAKLPKPGTGLEINFYETAHIGSGHLASNPWLQELPDTVTKTTWGNYLTIPVEYDGDNHFSGFNGLDSGDKVDLTVNGQTYRVGVVRQFGQMPGTVSIALGYGRTICGPAGKGVGTNLYPAVTAKDGYSQYHASGVEVSKRKGKDSSFACVQLHHTMGLQAANKKGNTINADERVLGWKGSQGSLVNRSVIRQTTATELPEAVEKLKEQRAEFAYLNEKTLYPTREEYTRGLHWGMSIDLSACIGCGACSVACMAENNVPVVGKFEIHRAHEMTWLRIDRYFYGEFENPNTVYQPMMCQHCDNAPCENVCPVAASNHSSEGLNQMAYNRCIGTRYCANNCPYKVRRFNWYDYTTADLFAWNEPNVNREMGNDKYYYMKDNLTRMVLNPDVTVRSRGVIEKCSFCVQRIQEGKLLAKTENRRLRDGDVKTACQTACPTGAIVFGNVNDEETKVSKLQASELNYFALEEINVKPGVGYLMKVTNKQELA